MAKYPVSLKALIKKEQDDFASTLAWNAKWDAEHGYTHPYPTEKEQEMKQRIREVRSNWAKFGDRPYIQAMSLIVDKEVERYLADFYKYDLDTLEEYPGNRFAWLVGDCGTWIMKLDAENEEQERHMQEWIDAIRVSDKGKTYKLYLVDQKMGTVKKATFGQLRVKILLTI